MSVRDQTESNLLANQLQLQLSDDERSSICTTLWESYKAIAYKQLKTASYGYEPDELVSMLYMCIWDWCRGYDITKNVDFYPYLANSFRGYVQSQYQYTGDVIHVPRNKRKQIEIEICPDYDDATVNDSSSDILNRLELDHAYAKLISRYPNDVPVINNIWSNDGVIERKYHHKISRYRRYLNDQCNMHTD